MSNYMKLTRHPKTGKWHNAVWIDDFYGKHKYGVAFKGDLFDTDYDDIYDPSKEKMDTDWEKDLIVVLNTFANVVKILELQTASIGGILKKLY